ncbi:MAG: hypothetical protein K2M08_01525 [Anaeroplasmataceae bacterium]|nr:hypothetical protein [Anaeroplasmataceae bacterium]
MALSFILRKKARYILLNVFNQINIDKTFFIKEILKEEQETFSINIEFCQKLFCGFSISDAINFLFSGDNIISLFEFILAEYSNEIKDISLSIECYDNPLAKRYYMNTDITGKAADIIRKLKCDIYFEIAKDGVIDFEEFNTICETLAGIQDVSTINSELLEYQLKASIKEKMIHKEENYKDIIRLRYVLKYFTNHKSSMKKN